jgi:hypothetical protein
METLFEIEPILPTKFCGSCIHRERHSYSHGTKVMQYCGKRKDNRNQFGLKRIKVTNLACELYELKIKKK